MSASDEKATEVSANPTAQAAFERGQKYYDNEDYDNAIKEYTEAIRLDPENEEVRELLREVQGREQRFLAVCTGVSHCYIFGYAVFMKKLRSCTFFT